MSYAHLENTVRGSPKLHRLSRQLGLQRAHGKGYVANLWAWAVDYAPDGDLSSYSAEEIEVEACDWEGEPGILIAALAEVGLLDRTEHGFIIHGYLRRANRYRKAQQKQRERETKRTGRRPVAAVSLHPVADLSPMCRPSVAAVSPDCRHDVAGEQSGAERSGAERSSEIANAISFRGPHGSPEPPRLPLELIPTEPPAEPQPVQCTIAERIEEVVQHHRIRHPGVKGTLIARRLIERRLEEGYEVSDLTLALDGVELDQWAKETHNVTIEHAMRQVDKCMLVAQSAPTQPPPQPTYQQLKAEMAARRPPKRTSPPTGGGGPPIDEKSTSEAYRAIEQRKAERAAEQAKNQELGMLFAQGQAARGLRVGEPV